MEEEAESQTMSIAPGGIKLILSIRGPLRRIIYTRFSQGRDREAVFYKGRVSQSLL